MTPRQFGPMIRTSARVLQDPTLQFQTRGASFLETGRDDDHPFDADRDTFLNQTVN